MKIYLPGQIIMPDFTPDCTVFIILPQDKPESHHFSRKAYGQSCPAAEFLPKYCIGSAEIQEG